RSATPGIYLSSASNSIKAFLFYSHASSVALSHSVPHAAISIAAPSQLTLTGIHGHDNLLRQYPLCCLEKLASTSSSQASPSRIEVQLDRRATIVKLSLFS
ncbi:unnamed protein product, partial [Brassica rapa subsp. narinosa]